MNLDDHHPQGIQKIPLNEEIVQKQEIIDELYQQLNSIKKTRSWRWMGAIRNAEQHVTYFYRKLPKPQRFLRGMLRTTLNDVRTIGRRMQGNVYRPHIPTDYQRYIAEYEREHVKHIVRPLRAPSISIIMPVHQPDIALLRAAVRSALEQEQKPLELIMGLDGLQSTEVLAAIGDMQRRYGPLLRVTRLNEHGGISAATNEAARHAQGEFLLLLDSDDLLAPHALTKLATAIEHKPATDFIYSDNDKMDINGYRFDPEFKPEWSPETMLAYCYVGHLKCIRRSLFERVGGLRTAFDGAQDYDLVLRITEHTNNIVHIPEVLYYWRAIPGSIAMSVDAKPDSMERGRKAVQEALVRRGLLANALRPPFAETNKLGIAEIRFHHAANAPAVTIVIASYGNPSALQRCIKSIITHTDYPHYQILVAHAGRNTERCREIAMHHRARFVCDTSNDQYTSAFHNTAATQVHTPLILFLNEEIEATDSTWLGQLVGTLLMDVYIGIVGTKLQQPNGRTSHVGMVLGMQNKTVGYLNRNMPATSLGYLYANHIIRNVSAVSGDCMVMRTKDFEALQGLDANHFPSAYSDVDLCLRMQEKGKRIVCNPSALLTSHETFKRTARIKAMDTWTARRNLRKRWHRVLAHDPYYSKHLSPIAECTAFRTYLPGKRLLLITHDLLYEGAPLVLLSIAKELQKRGYSIALLSPTDGPLRSAYEQNGMDVHIHPLHRVQQNTHFIDQFDALIANTLVAYPFIQQMEEWTQPVIWCVHESHRAMFIDRLPGLSAYQLSKPQAVVFVADATKAIYRDMDYGQFVTIYNGIDCAVIDVRAQELDKKIVRRMLGIGEKEHVILNVGTICERKGQQGIIHALSRLVRENDERKIRLIMVGGETGSKYEKYVKHLVKKYHLKKRVIIIPHVADVSPYYAAADMLVCNSFIESLPQVILEAMAWKVPIVATNIFGIPEQIRHEQEGLLVEAGNPEALAAAIKRLMNHPEFAQTLAARARTRVETHFTMKQMGNAYDVLVQNVIRREQQGVTTRV